MTPSSWLGAIVRRRDRNKDVVMVFIPCEKQMANIVVMSSFAFFYCTCLYAYLDESARVLCTIWGVVYVTDMSETFVRLREGVYVVE